MKKYIFRKGIYLGSFVVKKQPINFLLKITPYYTLLLSVYCVDRIKFYSS